MPTSPASKVAPTRGRRNARPSGDDREFAILATAERLLEERQLNDISVDDLAKGAGISRPTFYFYFPSKDAVLLTLLDRLVNEADAALAALDSHPDGERDPLWRNGINVFFATFASHRGVARAGISAMAGNAEVQELWSSFMQKWIAYSAAIIEVERDRGNAPRTLPSHQLAAALNLMNERTMFASFAAEQPSIPEERVLDTLEHIWVSSIYGGAR